jgi:hypothetical protein
VQWLVLVLSSTSFLFPQLLDDKRQHTLLMQGIDYTLRQEYDSAESTFQLLIQEFPKHPVGYLYLAGMLQAKYNDYGNSFNEKRYDSLLNVVETLSETLMNNKNTLAYGYFYTGCAQAFRSFTKSENGNLPSGIYYGFSAGQSLERCLEIDSNFTEAKNILGSFYYWRSKLAWIPFVPDKREKGIKFILESFSHPYEKHLASQNLMVIFTEEKRFADAEKYGLIMLSEYPDNRLILWDLKTVYEQWNRTNKLKNVIERLIKSTLGAKIINHYTEADCRLKLAQIKINENNRIEAAEELKRIIALRKYVGKTKGDLKKKIKKAEDLLEILH